MYNVRAPAPSLYTEPLPLPLLRTSDDRTILLYSSVSLHTLRRSAIIIIIIIICTTALVSSLQQSFAGQRSALVRTYIIRIVFIRPRYCVILLLLLYCRVSSSPLSIISFTYVLWCTYVYVVKRMRPLIHVCTKYRGKTVYVRIIIANISYTRGGKPTVCVPKVTRLTNFNGRQNIAIVKNYNIHIM